MALAMACIAVEEGITEIACTPHIYPGIYPNTAKSIAEDTEKLRFSLAKLSIPLTLHVGSDTHLVVDLIDQLRAKTVPTFSGGRYFLLEPAHRLPTPHFEASVFKLIAAGYIPIVTHPERLDWVSEFYPVFKGLAKSGAWMQITAGSLTGNFGKRPKYWAEKMLDEGFVHVMATDAHNLNHRSPRMREALEIAKRMVGSEEALRMVTERPKAALNNLDPADITPIPLISQRHNDKNSMYDKIKHRLLQLIKP